MGNWPRLVNVRRCARAFAFDAGEDNNTTIALLNTSTGPEYLIVWSLDVVVAEGNVYQISYQQLPEMENPFTTQAIVAGDAVPPGVVTTGDQPTSFTADYALNLLAPGSKWPATFPFAVLPPNWALVVQNGGGGAAALQASFWWEAIKPELLDHIHMDWEDL